VYQNQDKMEVNEEEIKIDAPALKVRKLLSKSTHPYGDIKLNAKTMPRTIWTQSYQSMGDYTLCIYLP
jgi:hypothetical protein